MCDVYNIIIVRHERRLQQRSSCIIYGRGRDDFVPRGAYRLASPGAHHARVRLSIIYEYLGTYIVYYIRHALVPVSNEELAEKSAVTAGGRNVLLLVFPSVFLVCTHFFGHIYV